MGCLQPVGFAPGITWWLHLNRHRDPTMIATELFASVYFERSNMGRIIYGRHSPDSLQAR